MSSFFARPDYFLFFPVNLTHPLSIKHSTWGFNIIRYSWTWNRILMCINVHQGSSLYQMWVLTRVGYRCQWHWCYCHYHGDNLKTGAHFLQVVWIWTFLSPLAWRCIVVFLKCFYRFISMLIWSCISFVEQLMELAGWRQLRVCEWNQSFPPQLLWKR